MRQRFDICRRSVVTSLVVLGLVLAMLGMAIRFAVLLPYLRERITEIAAANQQTVARYAAEDIAARVTVRLDFLRHLAATLPRARLSDPAALEAWLDERRQDNPVFTAGLVVVAAEGGDAIDPASREAVRRALAEPGPAIGAPLRDLAGGEPRLAFALAVREPDGRVAAVVVGAVVLGQPGFLDVVRQTRIGETGGLLLLSRRDRLVVAATGPTPAPASPLGDGDAVLDRVLAGFSGAAVSQDELWAVAPVSGTDWVLIARAPMAEAIGAMAGIRNFLIRNGVIFSVVMVLIVAATMAWRLRPLTRTAALIHRMAKGEIPLQPVPVRRRDEIGDLAEGFNVLVARIDELTAQKVEAERQRAEERDRIAASLRQWMADTSHELRTPLAVLQAQVEAIQDGVNAVDPRTLGVLHGQITGLSRLVDDLHILARSDVGRLDCRLMPVSVRDLLEEVALAFRERIAAAELVCQPPAADGPDPIVAADAARLRQVLANLVENSLRYTDAGGLIRLGCASRGDRVEIVVEDGAPAVPAEALPHLFERFYRADPSRARGSGIGLAVCKSLVEAHGGSIAAAPSDLGGLRVTVTLPVISPP